MTRCCKTLTGGSERNELARPFLDKYRDCDSVHPLARQAVRNLAKGRWPWPLVLLGGVGSGKTCLALCMLDTFAGTTGKYLTLAQLCDSARRAKTGDDPLAERSFWEYWQNARFIVLDEIGTRENVSDHHYETLKSALDYREGYPLVVMSNMADLGELRAIYDERIVSRMTHGTILQLRGDRRVTGK